MPQKIFDIIPPKGKKPSRQLLFEPKTQEPAKREEKRGSKLSNRKGFLVKGSILVVLFVVFLFFVRYAVLTKVVIELWQETEQIQIVETVTIATSQKQPDFEAKIVPGVIFEDEQSFSQEFSASGIVQKGVKAKGIIRVYNTYSASSQGLLISTRFVSADGKLFRSTKKEVIPGGKYEKGKLVPNSIDIEVQAAAVGEEYNIDPSTFSIPGFAGTPKYTAFYGKSFTAMMGGFKGTVTQVTQEDIEKAQEAIVQKLKQASLYTVIPADFVLLKEAITEEPVQIVSSAKEGRETEMFQVSVTGRSKGLAFRKSDMEQLARKLVNEQGPEDKTIKEDNFVLSYALHKLGDGNTMVVTVTIKANLYSDIDVAILKKALVGKSPQEAELFLGGLPDITRVEVSSWPFWRKYIPSNFDRIEIVVHP